MATTRPRNAKPQKRWHDWASSLVSIDPSTGAVKAMVVGPDFADSQTTSPPRPTAARPGSTFKVITLATALVQRLLARTTRVDGTSPVPCPSSSRGRRAVAQQLGRRREAVQRHLGVATADSVNCAFVRLATSVGYDKVIAMAHKMGITKQNLDEPDPQPDARDLEQNTETMATVMATIANHGVHHTPYVVQKVVGGRRHRARSTRPTTPASRCSTTRRRRLRANVLRGVVTGGTGGNASVPGQEIFGKTGTTDHTTDAWFIGANAPGAAGNATAVWFGNRTARCSRRRASVATPPAPVFAAFMSARRSPDQPELPLPDPGPGVRPTRRRRSIRTAAAATRCRSGRHGARAPQLPDGAAAAHHPGADHAAAPTAPPATAPPATAPPTAAPAETTGQ